MVCSSESSKWLGEIFAEGPVAVAFSYTTGLLHFAQNTSPFTRKSGDPQTGQVSESMVAPDLRRSAIRLTSSLNCPRVLSDTLCAAALFKSAEAERRVA